MSNFFYVSIDDQAKIEDCLRHDKSTNQIQYNKLDVKLENQPKPSVIFHFMSKKELKLAEKVVKKELGKEIIIESTLDGGKKV